MHVRSEMPLVMQSDLLKLIISAKFSDKFTDGRAVFASGSPFPDYVHNGKVYKPGQGNNAYIFPGVALGVIAAGIHHISDDVFLFAARVNNKRASRKYTNLLSVLNLFYIFRLLLILLKNPTYR